MKRLTPACKLVLFSLWHKRDYFSRRSMLDRDGSFYYDYKRLAEDTDLSVKTISRVVKFLVENWYIKVIRGHYKGNATKYWVCRKPDKKSPFIPLSKVDNLSAKVYNSSLKGPQNVSINKLNNKENNKEDFNNVSNEEDLKNGIMGLTKLKGEDFTREFYLGRGFSEDAINKAFANMSSLVTNE